MYYEKLAAAKKKKDNRTKDALKGIGIGAAGSLGGMALGAGSGVLAEKGIRSDGRNMKNLLRSMGAKRTGSRYGIGYMDKKTGKVKRHGRLGDIWDLTAKDGRKISIEMGAGKKDSMDAYYAPGSRRNPKRPKRRGTIRLGRGIMDEDVFFHELGHATGRGSKTKYRKVLENVEGVFGSKVGRGAQLLGGLGASGMAYSARNKQEADRANMAANATLGLSALGNLPTLAEEARASIRAVGLKKKFMKGKSARVFRNYLPAYGTYLGGALVNAAPGIAAKVMAKRKQRQFRENKEK